MVDRMSWLAVSAVFVLAACPKPSEDDGPDPRNEAKTSEAKVQLAKMYDASAVYFAEEHVARGGTSLIGAGGEVPDLAPHQCPSMDGELEVDSGITPPLDVDCSAGPGGRCVPSVDGNGAGYYALAEWNDNEVWNGLNFMMEQGHYFHYRFKAKNYPTGYGACQFTVQAFGDLDGDGTFSTYERIGAADQNGINASVGLYVDQGLE